MTELLAVVSANSVGIRRFLMFCTVFPWICSGVVNFYFIVFLFVVFPFDVFSPSFCI
jgi:hypothetical protein